MAKITKVTKEREDALWEKVSLHASCTEIELMNGHDTTVEMLENDICLLLYKIVGNYAKWVSSKQMDGDSELRQDLEQYGVSWAIKSLRDKGLKGCFKSIPYFKSSLTNELVKYIERKHMKRQVVTTKVEVNGKERIVKSQRGVPREIGIDYTDSIVPFKQIEYRDPLYYARVEEAEQEIKEIKKGKRNEK